jgi:hypothetical protein
LIQKVHTGFIIGKHAYHVKSFFRLFILKLI